MRKRITIIICIIFGLILLRYLYTMYNTHMSKVKMQKFAMPEIVVEKVGSKEIIKSFESPARVVAKYQVNVEARIDGYLLRSYFKEGDFVKAGQILFEIEPQEYQYALQQAQANMKSAKAMQTYYDKQSARAKQLVEKDYIAKADYDNAVAQRDSYRAQTAYAEMAYKDAMRNLSYTKVKAPVSGRVGIITVTVGNYVTLNSGALTTIYSTRPMYVTFPLEMEQYSTLSKIDGSNNVNRKVEYIFSSGDKYVKSGIQDFHDNKVDESTGTIKMRATFTNEDDALISGDFGRIIIYSNNMASVPVIPTKAIQENQEGKYVYKLLENNIPKLVYIKTVNQDGDKTLILSGLEVGDKVITSGLQKVVPGMEVKIVEKEVNETTQTQKEGLVQKLLNKIFKKENK